MFPPMYLAAHFGPDDADYAWTVFERHYTQLAEAGFKEASRILEIGPGRNLGTALLWCCHLSNDMPTEVVCWDVFPNASPNAESFWKELARALLEKSQSKLPEEVYALIRQRLCEIAHGTLQPSIIYRVESLEDFHAAVVRQGQHFDLIYSQAAIEHVWFIDAFWDAIGRITAPVGWHSHRIDLADHGRRDTNYVEMLEWSRFAYWLTSRFIPGAINRWRAYHHLKKLTELGFQVKIQRRTQRDRLPIPLSWISPEFRVLGDEELRVTALDVVAVNHRQGMTSA